MAYSAWNVKEVLLSYYICSSLSQLFQIMGDLPSDVGEATEGLENEL